jgi:pimeloyl-ACP methyl ester carboxylesterase
MLRQRWVKRPDALLSLRAAQTRRKGAPPLILLHGFPDFWLGWAPLIEQLRGSGQDLIAPDLRGYNDSETETSATFGLLTLVEDVLAIADALDAPVFQLMGHDWGGVIAWACAQAAPERLRSLCVLNAPHPFVFGEAFAADPTQRARSAYIAALRQDGAAERLGAADYAPLENAFASVAAGGGRDAATQAAYRAAWARRGRMNAMLAYYRATTFLDDGGVIWRPKAPIQTPTLLIWGEQDGAFAPYLPEAHHRIAAHLTIRRETDLGHWPHQEDPARVATRWREWVALID